MSDNDMQAVIDTAIAAVAPQKIDPEGRFFSVSVPNEGTHEVIDLDALRRDRPARKTGTVTVHDAGSMVAYLSKHVLPETEIWADVTARQIVAVINAHGTAAEGPDRLAAAASAVEADEVAGYSDHRCRLTLHHTPAWIAWAAFDGKLLPQVAFAEHIENRLIDIAKPPAAEMLEMAQSFQAKRSLAYESSQALSTGEVQFEYKETLGASAGKKGRLEIPKVFTLGLAPFEGTLPYEVTARLRYRIEDATLKIGYQLDRPEDVLRAAFADVIDQIAEGVGETPIFRGTP